MARGGQAAGKRPAAARLRGSAAQCSAAEQRVFVSSRALTVLSAPLLTAPPLRGKKTKYRAALFCALCRAPPRRGKVWRSAAVHCTPLLPRALPRPARLDCHCGMCLVCRVSADRIGIQAAALNIPSQPSLGSAGNYGTTNDLELYHLAFYIPIHSDEIRMLNH